MGGTKDPKQLVADILSKVGASSGRTSAAPAAGGDAHADPEAKEPAPQAPRPASAPSDEQVADLIDVYFTLEEPAERDVAFDTLAGVNSDITTDFFVAMMTQDEDAYMRRAAAAELARRGHPEALASLQEDLAKDADPRAFEQAMETLALIQGDKFVPVVANMWKDPARNSRQRRVAMSIFEWLDPPRAMTAFVAFVDSIVDVKNFADDTLEQAMAAFGRQEYKAALAALRALQARIAAATWDDADEKLEALGFVGEGIALLED